MKVVVVESPAKAKTINRYLGDDYIVLASYGHVRDLPSKDGSVQPDQDFEMSWQLSDSGGKRIKDITDALKGADRLILATDPDREGEAISWHVCELLKAKKESRDIPYERVVFNEITKSAILTAMDNPRDLDIDLVDAYLARRALDHLIGFSISPVLWRKLPGSKSAGRVQSVALRLICEREGEIERFITDEYWSVDTLFKNEKDETVLGRLTQADGVKLDKLSIKTEAEAKQLASRIDGATWSVGDVETKRVKRRPAPPFTTSTLQQEASRKLGFSASRTMQIAQKLYEGIALGAETTGLITYMRTDGVSMSGEAIAGVRSEITNLYGAEFTPEKPRFYKTKAANAQEAHEAIRPTSFSRQPQDMRRFLDFDQFRLFELIWKRAIASQMEDAQLDQTAMNLVASDDALVMRTTGSILVFDGFIRVYREDKDDSQGDADDQDKLLPALKAGDALDADTVSPEQHFTQPPARFTDASLIKRLEELGIGRPSTYASILQVLEKRSYVIKDSKRFIPEHRGRIVSVFLENFFSRYVEYNFTAGLETQLDDVSGGRMEWRHLLRDFWKDFSLAVSEAKDLPVPDVMEKLDSQLETLFFTPDEKGEINRSCSKCESGKLELKLGKFGPFLGCKNYPECKYIRQIAAVNSEDDGAGDFSEDKLLGTDTATDMPVFMKRGPYGLYVQLGDADVKKPKRTSVPKGTDIAAVDLPYALGLLSLPRDIGTHPETGEMIQAGLGRFGPYLKYQGKFASLKDDDVLEVGINRAVDVLAEAAKTAGRLLGTHPEGSGEVHLKKGRFGPYIEHNKMRAPVPRGTEMTDITLEDGVRLLAERAAKPAAKKKSSKTKVAAKKKTAAKKKPFAKKATAKKKAAPKA